MTPLLTSLLAADDGEPRHRDAFEAVARGGLPGPRSERWKYTSLRALERRSFAAPMPAPSPAAALLAHIPAPRLVFVNGFHDAAASDLTGLPVGVVLREAKTSDAPDAFASQDPYAAVGSSGADGDAVFARLNAALARSGAWLHVPAGVACPQPIHVAFAMTSSDADEAWNLRHRVAIGDGASVTLVEHHVGLAPNRHLANHAFDVRVGAGAVLRHVRAQSTSDGTTLVQSTAVDLATDARCRRIDLELGAALSRHELAVALSGERATLCSGGVLLANGRRHVDTRLAIRHVARDTTCDLRWRGLAADRGRAVFHGGIVIAAGADGSDARLSNKNLLLSDGAEIDAQPVLEIHADEVKAAHGATVGRLDASALFYLRSRGLAEADARRMLTIAFVREVLAALDDPALSEMLGERLDAALAPLDAA